MSVFAFSDHNLQRGNTAYSCTELRCLLPPDWPLTPEALDDPNWNWPVVWLERIVRELRALERWPAEPVTFMNGDAPVGPNTKLSGWLCLLEEGESVKSAMDRSPYVVSNLLGGICAPPKGWIGRTDDSLRPEKDSAAC